MNTLKTQRLAWSLALAMTASCVATAAQEGMQGVVSTGLTRDQVVAELLATQKTHRWDEPSAQWVPRGPTRPAASDLTRADVRAELAVFTSAHRFDESQGGWVARNMPPRAEDELTRRQVAASTILFLETHAWDESTQLWTEHARVSRTR